MKHMKYSDNTLVDGILSKDKQAFEVMYETYFQKIYNYTFYHVGNKQHAEQVTEEIFTEVVTTLEHCPKGSFLSKWVFKITTKHINQFKNRQNIARSHLLQVEDKSLTDLFKFEQALLENQKSEVVYGG
ncbi:MAG: hypothetical protein AABY87_11700 [bacterium]